MFATLYQKNDNKFKYKNVFLENFVKIPSTRVLRSGYDLLTLRKPSNIFGNSEGFTGSTAILITEKNNIRINIRISIE